ncbi:p24 complex component [Bachmanniomyces sp. S44760]|nr:p24 complex component [Bachmanniomyces sp. S44760]
MRPFISAPLALLTTLLSTSIVRAHNIQMGAHSRECFHEQLHKDDKMTVTFQVGDREFGGSGNLEIDFWVSAFPLIEDGYIRLLWSMDLWSMDGQRSSMGLTVAMVMEGGLVVELADEENIRIGAGSGALGSMFKCQSSTQMKHVRTGSLLMTWETPQIQNPSGAYQVHERAISSGDHSFEARLDGKYVYCFSNEHWSANSKEVSFNVHGIVYVPESEAPGDPLEVEVKSLSTLLASVKDEQSYIVIRERTHRNTAESTNGRVKWWSIFQIGVLIGEGVFQVWWLKRFFEVKRVV